MSTLAPSLPTPRLVSADLLKLRRRRGLVAVTGLLTVAVVVVTYTIIELLHVASPATHEPAGGAVNLGPGVAVVALLGAVAAAIVAATAAAGDLDALVYRDLVVTGRSRLALYLSRIPAGLLFLLPFMAVTYAITAGVSVLFADTYSMPSASLIATTGVWLALPVTFYYLLGFGLASLLGSRSYSIGIVLAFRLAVAPLVASISSIGIVRELVPIGAVSHLAPAGLGTNPWMGVPAFGVSIGATAAVLLAWTVIPLALGARRDTTRDA
jgi:ABC-type transport system involved in multi-copper enzyme maturation permease subunit